MKFPFKNMSTRQKWVIFGISGLVLIFLFIPVVKFDVSYSTVISDRNNVLLSAHIADDEQWRFPPGDSLPEKFKQAILLFEDEYFYYHPGVNPVSLSRAFLSNIKNRRVVSGGSTITMQLIRLARPAPRTILHKLKEIILALRMEASLSKDSILGLYAAHAPFGGNTVGIEAASWRYFNHPTAELTWSETALLAVLPNAPSLMHPGKGRDELEQKRNRLLQKIHKKGLMSDTELQLSLLEALPDAPQATPQLAPHLLDRQIIKQRGSFTRLSIDSELQRLAAEIVERHSKILQNNEIYNAAAIIASVETGEVLAYVGNSKGKHSEKGYNVDIITSSRSSGSVLKPFLYAYALQEGLILPESLLPDIPTYYRSYTPQNYQRRFDGAVPADKALSRSLNIPFVRLLNDYDGQRFVKNLKEVGFRTIDKPYTHYGLSLILGGCEVSLWDLAGAYASLGRTLNYYLDNNSSYSSRTFRPLQLLPQEEEVIHKSSNDYSPTLKAAPIYFTLKALTGLERPIEESGWENFSSSRQIAWKTGTSFGFRDAWAVGLTPEYVVAVWVGNASGEGRPGIVGGTAAGPILFELFNLLPATSRLQIPYDDLIEQETCSQSGERASSFCPNPVVTLIPNTVKKTFACPYHKLIHLSPDGLYRTSIEHEKDGGILSKSYFVLPPLMEWYYRKYHPEYITLPPYKAGFELSDNEANMDLIYPPANTTVLIPRDLSGNLSRMVIRAVHRREGETVYWHLNGKYLGSTEDSHEMEILPEPGPQQISLIDSKGNSLVRKFICAGDEDLKD